MTAVKNNDVEIARYQYDPLGRRISKTVAGTTIWYLYSDWGLIAELDQQGTIIVAYGWQPNSDWGTQPLWQARPTAGGSLQTAQYHYLHTDHLGSPQLAVNASGQPTWEALSEAFGQVKPALDNQITINLRFPGQYFDSETGTHYNYFRDYNPAIGRYIQKDPIGLAGGRNFYGYSLANPVLYSDPHGLFVPLVIGGYYLSAQAVAWLSTAIVTTAILSSPAGQQAIRDTAKAIDDSLSDCETKTCPPCSPPAGQMFNKVTHFKSHGRDPMTGSHGCEQSTGSPVHWHYDVNNQDPVTCKCYLQAHRFGGCGMAPP